MGAKNSKLKTDTTASSTTGFELGSHQGYALIFNQEEFFDPSMNRKGSRKDETALQNVLSQFALKVTVQRSKPKSEIFATMKKMAYLDYSKCRCIVLVIMTHGTDGGGLWASDETFNKTEIIDMLIEFEELAGKPKIVIIQACRGSKHSTLVNVKTPKSTVQTDSAILCEPRNSVPKESELLICYSSFEGRFSYRDTNKGTIFIQSLCTILNEHGRTENIERLFTLVKQAVVKSNDKYKQMPTTESTLTKDFCLGTYLTSKTSEINKNSGPSKYTTKQESSMAPVSKYLVKSASNSVAAPETSTSAKHVPNIYKSIFSTQSDKNNETQHFLSRPNQFNYNSTFIPKQSPINRPAVVSTRHQPPPRSNISNIVNKTSKFSVTPTNSSISESHLNRMQNKTQVNYHSSYSSSSSSSFTSMSKSTFTKNVSSSPNFTQIKTEKRIYSSKK